MWAYAALYLLGWPLLMGLITAIVIGPAAWELFDSAPDSAALELPPWVDTASTAIDILNYAAMFIIIPAFANRLYFRHVRRKVEKVSLDFSSDNQRRSELARIGGTNLVAALLIYAIPWVILVLVVVSQFGGLYL